MKSIILCEGKTDLILLSYYLDKVAGWRSIDKKENKSCKLKLKDKINKFNKESRNQDYYWYFKDNNVLCIYATGSNNMIIDGLEQVIDLNMNTNAEKFDKVAIVSDRDDEYVDKGLFQQIEEVFNKNNITFNAIAHNVWNESNMYSTFGLEEEDVIEILPLIIPFEETGTLETFLLNSRKSLCQEDRAIIDKGNLFVDELCKDEAIKSKYLKSRGIVPKVKLGVYFSVASPNSTFEAGDKILTSIPWEKYTYIRECFKELERI